MNPNTMTLDECRDWLAVATGYWLEACDCDTCTIVGNGMLQCWRKAGDSIRYHEHPIPPTLDAAASAMPEGWDWRRVGGEYLGGNKVNGGGIVTRASVTDTDDEKLDRARLAVACRMAAKKEPNRE